MKTVQKINSVLFPYFLTLLGFWLIKNMAFFLGGVIVFFAFCGWMVTLVMYYGELNKLNNEGNG